MRAKTVFPVAMGLCLLSLSFARAGALGRLRHSITSLRGRKAQQQQQARDARARANELGGEADELAGRLEAAQQLAQEATSNYYNYFDQMRRTEKQIVGTRHRLKVVKANYSHHRALFGRRLAVIQRTGQISYLQIFLGSRTLSDLSRRAYFFQALTQHDAQLQAQLKSDRSELETAQRRLAQEWHHRSVLQVSANRERVRVVDAERDTYETLYRINSSRYQMIAYSREKESSSEEIGDIIAHLQRRRTAIADEYNGAAMHRGRALFEAPRHRSHHRVWRVRSYRHYRRYHSQHYSGGFNQPPGGGLLQPMPIWQLQSVSQQSSPLPPASIKGVEHEMGLGGLGAAGPAGSH